MDGDWVTGSSDRRALISRLRWLGAALAALGTTLGGCASDDLPPAVVEQLQQQAPVQPQASSPSDRLLVPATGAVPSTRLALRSVDDWTLSETAEHALGRIGAPAVPYLREKLRQVDADPRRQALVRQRAADVLAQIGPEARDAVPDLTAALRDPSAEVRKSAAFALGQIGPDAAGAVAELLDVMLEAEAAQRNSVSGPQAVEYLPAPE
ncbi:MAG: HEAT repeat domain-containing protein [Pirellulaceae bacterium]|nr:HEAT repeat domain-containing protein [Pirellulaceae bacterium]